MRVFALLIILALLCSVSLGKDSQKRLKGQRPASQGSRASSSAPRTARRASEDEYRPSTREGLEHTPRDPVPGRRAALAGRSNIQAALATHNESGESTADESEDSSVIVVETTGGPAVAAPASQPPPRPAAARSRSSSHATPPATAGNLPSSPPAPVEDLPASPPAPFEDLPSSPPAPVADLPVSPPAPVADLPSTPRPGVTNPLDLEDPPYCAVPPDTPERVGRRHLLLNTAPPSLQFYAHTDPESNNTDIDTIDRLLDHTLHPRFVFDRAARADIFDNAIDDVGRTLRRLELKTNAHFILHIGLPDDDDPKNSRHCQLLASRVIDGNNHHAAIAQRLSAAFERHIANLRREEVQEDLKLAREEEDERIAAQQKRTEWQQRAQRNMEAAMAANRAERPANQPVSAKRPLSSPEKEIGAAKKRKEQDESAAGSSSAGKQASSSGKAASASARSIDKGKGRAQEVTRPPSPLGSSNEDALPATPPPPHNQGRSMSVVASSEPTEEEADSEYWEAVQASLKTVITDEARRRGEPVASSSRVPVEALYPGSSSNARAREVEPAAENAVALRNSTPNIHRPEPLLPAPVIPLLVQLAVPPEYWAAIEVVWTTAPRSTYADALMTVSDRCGLGLSIVDVYNLAALLARTPPPHPEPM